MSGVPEAPLSLVAVAIRNRNCTTPPSIAPSTLDDAKFTRSLFPLSVAELAASTNVAGAVPSSSSTANELPKRDA